MRILFHNFVLVFGCALLAALISSCDSKRQVADKNFNTTVVQPAFTADECDAVRSWVEAGGSSVGVYDLVVKMY